MGTSEVEHIGAGRRTVLIGAGAAGVAAVLAGCGSKASPAGTGGNANRGVAAQSGTAASGTAPALTVKTSEIPVGGGAIFADQKIVVTQPTAGDILAFTAICTHMGCTVASIANGLIMCPCHGSEYSITDGSVKRGPAPSPLAAKQVSVSGGEISVSG